MNALPPWVFALKNEIIEGFNKALKKSQQTQQPPPPGAASDFVIQAICKHAPNEAMVIKKPLPTELDQLTPDNIYASPPQAPVVPQDTGDSLEDRAVNYVKAHKPIRLADLASALGCKPPELVAVLESSTKLVRSGPGWIKAA